MKNKRFSLAGSALAALALVVPLALGATGAQAGNQKDDKAEAAGTSSAKKAKPGKVKFVPGSEESAKERATRLKRECKGAVNAGACQGYTG